MSLLSHIDLPSAEFLLAVGRAVFLVFSFLVAAISFTAWRGAARRQTAEVLAQSQIVLQRLAELEARVDATKSTVTALGEQLQRPGAPAASSHSPSPGYQIAIRLARGGASREELMSACGLTPAEAELVRRLHAPHAAELRQVS